MKEAIEPNSILINNNWTMEDISLHASNKSQDSQNCEARKKEEWFHHVFYY